jgi:putative spermidine/putrescine transport system ATP-binding protein
LQQAVKVNAARALDVEDLSVRYGMSTAVDGVTLAIEPGEVVALLGPSGCGKTTLLRVIAGFVRQAAGRVRVDGATIDHLPPNQRNIGIVFQNYALFPHMTVAENLAFPLEVRNIGKAEREARVKKVLDMVQLPQMASRRPGQLSGGQQQRIAVARALVFEPDLVLMDEPLGALDKQLREQMQYEIKHIHDRLGVTVVYVTHDQSEALTMSNRIAVFNDGVVQQLSTPADLYERPKNSFVAQFIGENNKLKGQVAEVGSDGISHIRLENGDMVKALAVNVKKGERTLLSVRPERVEINPGKSAVDGLLQGKIAELIYVGDHIRARLQVAGHDDFIVKVPNKANMGQVEEGKTVHVGWKAADCRALDFAEFAEH